ncbi:MAG: hypothetical protein FGM48_07205 [Candidatus Nanopelagicaceae bacterium]|nr:hypothetical protein [Candidatus Nanopelagicaceae bacterium]
MANLQLLWGVLIGFIAYAMGRNFLIYFVLAWFYPLFAVLILVVRHKAKPKPANEFIYDRILRIKLRLWSRKSKPDDFNDET